MCPGYPHQPPEAWRNQQEIEHGAQAAGGGPVEAHGGGLVRRNRDHCHGQAVQKEGQPTGQRRGGLNGDGRRQAVGGDEDVGGKGEADYEGQDEGGIGQGEVGEPQGA